MSDRPPSRQTRRRHGPDGGSPTVFVADERVDAGAAAGPAIDGARWMALAERVLEAERISGDVELSLLFVDEATIVDLNAQFMQQEGPTDVLSFPIDGDLVEPGRWPDGGSEAPARRSPDAEDLPLLLGDVVICPAVAARNAPQHAGSFEDEVALLVVHGVLHLLGMDHADDADRVSMQRRERELLDTFYGSLARDPWVTP